MAVLSYAIFGHKSRKSFTQLRQPGYGTQRRCIASSGTAKKEWRCSSHQTSFAREQPLHAVSDLLPVYPGERQSELRLHQAERNPYVVSLPPNFIAVISREISTHLVLRAGQLNFPILARIAPDVLLEIIKYSRRKYVHSGVAQEVARRKSRSDHVRGSTLQRRFFSNRAYPVQAVIQRDTLHGAEAAQ